MFQARTRKGVETIHQFYKVNSSPCSIPPWEKPTQHRDSVSFQQAVQRYQSNQRPNFRNIPTSVFSSKCPPTDCPWRREPGRGGEYRAHSIFDYGASDDRQGHYLGGAEAVDGTVLQAQRGDAHARAVVHDEVQGKVLDEELRKQRTSNELSR